MKKLISSEYNEVSGLTTNYYSVDNDTKIIVQVTQDVEPILQNNVAELNAKSSKGRQFFNSDGLGPRVASIPMGLVEKLAKDRGLNLLTCSNAQLKKFINDSDYKKVRTSHGRV